MIASIPENCDCDCDYYNVSKNALSNGMCMYKYLQQDPVAELARVILPNKEDGYD